MGAGHSSIWAEDHAKALFSGSTNRRRTWLRCILGGRSLLLGPWPWKACSAENLPLALLLLTVWLSSSQFQLLVLNGDHEIPTFQGCAKYSIICKMLHKWGNFSFCFPPIIPIVKIGDKRKHGECIYYLSFKWYQDATVCWYRVKKGCVHTA